jgi:BirA family biotin operon repressor/biotin-[acetyl-CoA-carboxylase] ligase
VSPEPLNEAAIRAGLDAGAGACLEALDVHRSIDSTNSELARGAAPGKGARVCLADRQTAGRGRRGRTWISPPGGNIYLSVAWRFAAGPEALQGLSLAVGVALCDALGDLGVDGLGLKWPNDVLRKGGKLAGVLVELQGSGAPGTVAIIGVGLNVVLPGEYTEEIGQAWADLRDRDPPRNAIVSAFLNRLLPLLDAYADTGFAPWRARWEALHVHAGQTVRVEQSGRQFAGAATGVDATGALLVATTAGLVPVHGGEVSLRPVP